jgi:hypothetical protein
MGALVAAEPDHLRVERKHEERPDDRRLIGPRTQVQVRRLIAGPAIEDPVERLAGPPIDVDPPDERRPVADAAVRVDEVGVDRVGR